MCLIFGELRLLILRISLALVLRDIFGTIKLKALLYNLKLIKSAFETKKKKVFLAKKEVKNLNFCSKIFWTQKYLCKLTLNRDVIPRENIVKW